MAKLYRNATTRDYYTKTRIKGEFVTLQIDNDGKNYLLQNGIVSQREIPPEMMALLWQKGWLYTRGEYPHIFTAEAGAPVQQPLALGFAPVNASTSLHTSGKQLELDTDSRRKQHSGAKPYDGEDPQGQPSSKSPFEDGTALGTPVINSTLPPKQVSNEPGFVPNIYTWGAVALILVIAVGVILELI